jgi:phosphoglycolate phosphatase-like HAD superfamily hydrolase
MENDGITQMEAIIGFEDVINPKPDPEGLLKVAKMLHVTPEESIMVGDSEFDIIAGQKAGMRTVGIRSGLHPEAMEAAKPDYVFDEMYQITTLF